MPFTVTHVAAVIPVAWLCRWRLPLSALAVGAMIPDISGFYPGLFEYQSTHSVRGILTHCVPIGLIAFYLFHLVLKQPLVDLMPDGIQRRLHAWSMTEIDVHPKRLMVVLICVAFGAATHVFWDSFTHAWSWGVLRFPVLQETAFEYQGHAVKNFAVLQHLSSVIFLPPLLLGFAWWVMRQPISDLPSQDRISVPRIHAMMAAATMALGAWLYFHSLRTHQVEATTIAALRTTVKHCGAVTMLLLFFYCVTMQLIWWRTSDRQTDGRRFADPDEEIGLPETPASTIGDASQALNPAPIMGTDPCPPALDQGPTESPNH